MCMYVLHPARFSLYQYKLQASTPITPCSSRLCPSVLRARAAKRNRANTRVHFLPTTVFGPEMEGRMPQAAVLCCRCCRRFAACVRCVFVTCRTPGRQRAPSAAAGRAASVAAFKACCGRRAAVTCCGRHAARYVLQEACRRRGSDRWSAPLFDSLRRCCARPNTHAAG